MSKVIFDILNYVNEGIIILNDKFDILFWNKYMEDLVGIKKYQVMDTSIFETIPGLDKDYYRNVFNTAIEKDYKYFFSSEIHKDIISNDLKLNIRINKFDDFGSSCLMIEFIDVTNQFIRINQLKEYANKLYSLNRELHEKEKQIEKLAYYDQLTNLANRTLFYRIAEKLLENAKRKNSMLGIMFIDVDRFKSINDEYGHRVGDKVLIEVSNILAKSTRETDTVARHGGDEFLILLPNLDNYSNYKAIAKRIANENNKIKIDDIEIMISLSIGVSFYPQDGNTIDELISKADKAMYRVKNIGGNESIHYISR